MCSHIALRLFVTLTTIRGWRSIDKDASAHWAKIDFTLYFESWSSSSSSGFSSSFSPILYSSNRFQEITKRSDSEDLSSVVSTTSAAAIVPSGKQSFSLNIKLKATPQVKTCFWECQKVFTFLHLHTLWLWFAAYFACVNCLGLSSCVFVKFENSKIRGLASFLIREPH